MPQLHSYRSRLENILNGLDKRVIFIVLLSMEGLIFLLDDFTGPFVSFAPYYILPIALSAWFLDRKISYLFVTISSLARVYVFSGLFPPNNPFFYVYDIFQSAALYSTVEIMVWNIRRLNGKLANHATHLENQVSYINQQIRLKASIRRALPEDTKEIVRLTVVGAKDGGLDEDILTTVRQHALATATHEGIVEGRVLRDIWTGGTAPVPIEFWVLIVNRNVAGFFVVAGIDDKKGTERELHTLVVSDACRGLGVGSAMTDFFCSHFNKRRLFAACKPDSKMVAMLKRRGFKQFGTSANPYLTFERRA